MTVLEILMASAIAVVVIIGLGVIDVNRSRQQHEMSTRTRTLQDQTGVSLAMSHIAQTIEQADRLNIIHATTGDTLQARRFMCPAPSCSSGCQAEPLNPSCFDTGTNYQWVEYRRLSDGTLQFLTNQGGTCGTPLALSDRVTALVFQYATSSVGSPPPGGNPFGTDTSQNNVVNYSLTWDNGTSQHKFEAHAVSRAIAYSNVNTQGTAGYGDSGSGVGPTGSPPSVCP